jgi:hypothetical protein
MVLGLLAAFPFPLDLSACPHLSDELLLGLCVMLDHRGRQRLLFNLDRVQGCLTGWEGCRGKRDESRARGTWFSGTKQNPEENNAVTGERLESVEFDSNMCIKCWAALSPNKSARSTWMFWILGMWH